MLPPEPAKVKFKWAFRMGQAIETPAGAGYNESSGSKLPSGAFHAGRSGSQGPPVMDLKVCVRPEREADAAAMRAIHEQAFPTLSEARLVELLRARRKIVVSLVAEAEGRVVGHVLFSRVFVSSASITMGAGLAPLAVLPTHEGRGIGSLLVRRGLAACRRAGQPFAVVLGAPAFYRRFGFRRASEFGLGNEYGVDEEFMVVELRPGGLPEGGGLVKYASEFAEVDV